MEFPHLSARIQRRCVSPAHVLSAWPPAQLSPHPIPPTRDLFHLWGWGRGVLAGASAGYPHPGTVFSTPQAWFQGPHPITALYLSALFSYLNHPLDLRNHESRKSIYLVSQHPHYLHQYDRAWHTGGAQ